MEVWSNGTGQKLIENILQLWTNLFNIVGELARAIFNAWNNAKNGTNIIQAIADVMLSIQDIVISVSESLLNWVISPDFQEALNILFNILSALFGYVQQIAIWISQMYVTYLAPVVDKILACISKIIIAIGTVWDFLKPIIDVTISAILDTLEPVIEGLCGVIKGIIDALMGVADFIIGVFTADWELVWKGLEEISDGIINAIIFLIKGLYNTIVALSKGALDILKALWNVLSGWFNDFVIKPVVNLFKGLWDGLKNGAKNARRCKIKWRKNKRIFICSRRRNGNSSWKR